MNPTEKLEQLSKEAKEKGFDKSPERKNSDSTDTSDSKNESSSKDDLTTAQKLMQIIQYIDFFKDRSGTAWAKVDSECYPVRSTAFKRKLQRIYYQRHGKTPYSQALQDVLDQATGIALFDSGIQDVHVRVAKKDRCIVVDQYDGQISITPDGWEQGGADNINFWQPQGLNPLPLPEKHSDGINILRKYLNFDSEADFRLLLSWLLAAYNPEIPCPILALQGEQGSAKSTNTKVLRALIDPSGAMINPAPREERSLVIQAQNSRVLCLDNLSGLKKWLSDALCRICTGTGFSTRRLYTNDEQQIFQVQRPIILNGIDDIATRGDLLDRSIVLNLPAIPPEKRKDEREFWKNFNRDRPYILDALYKTISAGLAAQRPQLQALPRMADFAEWITRCETGLHWENGSMLNAYNLNKDNAIETGLDGDYLGIAIQKILEEQSQYKGTATELVEKLREVSAESSHKYLPTTRTLKSKLTRLAPALRKVGITWSRKHTERGNEYLLDKSRTEPSVPSVPSEIDKKSHKTEENEANEAINDPPSKSEFDDKFNSYEDSPF